MTDAGLAEVLAELAADPRFPGYAEDAWDGGRLGSTVRRRGGHHPVLVEAQVDATLRGRTRRVAATIELPPSPGDFPPRIVSWQLLAGGEQERAGIR
jgi:hypothetical protein